MNKKTIIDMDFCLRNLSSNEVSTYIFLVFSRVAHTYPSIGSKKFPFAFYKKNTYLPFLWKLL